MNELSETDSTSKGVEVATCTAKQLLCANGVITSKSKDQTIGTLNIPEYQRPYRWREQQIIRFLDDLKVHDESLKSKDKSADLKYYLGSAILHDDGKQLNIIDGQQRITTLALLGHVSGKLNDMALSYESPISQQQIKANLKWLKVCGRMDEVKAIDFDKLQFTLVITKSEDDAYQFFETQNTGGVRLSGPDIIKAHHLRAVEPRNVNGFALRWEAMGNLNPVVGALLRGRYWRGVGFRDYPPHNQPVAIRTSIVSELAELTDVGEDTAYARITRTRQLGGAESVHTPIVGYELRQPLNSGANTIHYLQFFEELRRKYLVKTTPTTPQKDEFQHFYQQLVCQLDGCGYLKQLYDACLLMYISQFGEQHLFFAAVKIFRVVYSRRVENRKAVREQSVAAFVKDKPVLDWIAVSYTPRQCFLYFDGFELIVSKDGLAADKDGVKKRFVLDVIKYFKLNAPQGSLSEENTNSDKMYVNTFGKLFSEKVRAL